MRDILSSFSCTLNQDVEYFLRYKSIEFTKQNISPTYLIFTSYKNEIVLIGYYTLTAKIISIKSNILSKTMRKRIAKFGTFDKESKQYRLPASLIAQLGKNFSNNYNKLITVGELLKLACNRVRKVQEQIGGKVVYIECEDKECLIEFYKRNDFHVFGKRNLDNDEKDRQSGSYLIQMLRYLS